MRRERADAVSMVLWRAKARCVRAVAPVERRLGLAYIIRCHERKVCGRREWGHVWVREELDSAASRCLYYAIYDVT